MTMTSFDSSSFSRPLLVILDRNLDLATPLHHTWTYQALAHDVLELQLNRITLPSQLPLEGGASLREQEKTYDLLPSDKFWELHKGRWVQWSGTDPWIVRHKVLVISAVRSRRWPMLFRRKSMTIRHQKKRS